MANLYQISGELIVAFGKAIDPETGEIISEKALEELGNLQMEFDTKVENVALYIKNLEAEAEALKKEKDAFAQREKIAKNKVENLKKYLGSALNGEKFESTRCKISFRKSEAVNVTDINLIDDDYLKFKEPEPDKTKIKKALKDGIELKGVELVTNYSIQIK